MLCVRSFFLISFLVIATLTPSYAASCKKVGPSDKISINSTSLRNLQGVGIDRLKIFESLKDVSIPETSGCWAGVTGNFDGQIISAGVLQWNFGQDSLQSILKAYQNQFSTDKAYEDELARVAPTYGKLIFSKGCLSVPIADDCKQQLLSLQTSGGKLQTPLQKEFDALFESDPMLQVQTDRFLRLLESVRDDLRRLFGQGSPSTRQIKWAIDTKVQQGKFPGDADIKRIRNSWSALKDASARKEKLHSLIKWYDGLSNAPDQDGTNAFLPGTSTKAFEKNSEAWHKIVSSGNLSEEQIDLLHLTFLKSRTAQGQAGRWQALTFQRRATIIFGAGCVAGQCVGI